MKLRCAILLLFTAALLTSCWKTDEDWSLCEDENLVLTFRIQHVPDSEFGEHIGEVDVFLFDSDLLFIETRKVAAPMADGTHGAAFTVEPGTYYAVCWGNTGDNSRLINNNFEDSYIEIDSEETGDKIYYAPYKTPLMRPDTRAESDYELYKIVVPVGKKTTKEMLFAKAHRTVEIFVSGYENTGHYDDGTAPLVERSGARGSYDFMLRADSTPRTLRQICVPTDRAGVSLSAAFHSALVPMVGDGWVRICNPATGAVIGEVKLVDYVATHQIEDDSYIPIHFIFDMDANVSVGMPSWIDNPITPGD